MSVQKPLTKEEAAMAVRIGDRAAEAVRQGASHLDAIATQMQASGIDPWERAYNLVGHAALVEMCRQVPVWKGPVPKGAGHTTGWLEFVGSGEPDKAAEAEDSEEGEGLPGFQIKGRL